MREFGKEFKNAEEILNYIREHKGETFISLKELQQHEEKIIKQERQKVIAELEEWAEKASNNYISKFDINGQDALFLVKQKLNEMKGK